MIRLDQGTTLRVLAPRRPGRPLIDLPSGIIELFSPGNRPLDVETPYVTAGVFGTEFFVLVDTMRRFAEVGVITGQVQVENPQGRLSLAVGEGAIARPGSAPRRIEIRPRDQVRWAIFYPPAMWDLPIGGALLDPRVRTAWQAWRVNDFPATVRIINTISSTEGLNAVSLDYLAAVLISLGRVDEAGALLNQSVRLDPNSPRAPALRSIIDVATNQTQQAIRAADVAVALAPTNPAARIAQSFALQAGLRLEEARSALLAATPADDPLVLARLAEIEFYLGNIVGSRNAANRAVAVAPSLSRPRSILGFADLAQFRFSAAEETFRAAVKLDPADPLPRLGLGLTAIRLGKLSEGTKELEVAVALDPISSALRSYLGKADAADSDHHAALRQWKLAKEFDPKDPTPWLYEALLERSLNRPGDALTNLQQSIQLNDNRAVYRSRLLLDQDLATRGADLAGIYRDLDFGQAAIVQGYKSVNTDPSDASAHRFLSETAFDLPRHETASDSERLQSLLLQPLDINPPPPRLARQVIAILPLFEPYRIGYNEFSPLFASDGLGLLTDGFAGNFGTIGGTLLANGLYRDLSMSAGQFYSRTSGIHPNGDLRRQITDVIFQPALSDQASLFAEYRSSNFDAGDFQNRFNLGNFNPAERQIEGSHQYRIGGHFDPTPGVTFVSVWTRGVTSALTDFGSSSAARQKVNADTGEAAVYLTGNRFNVIAGGSVLSGDDRLNLSTLGFQLPSTNFGASAHSIWLYNNLVPVVGVRLSLAAAFDQLNTIFNQTEALSRSKFNPKLGISWDALPNTTVRAAWFSMLKRPLIGDISLRNGETIEPTQIAAFNQLFDDPPGTKAQRWGIGLDQRMPAGIFGTDTVLLGAEWSERQLVVPITVTDPFTTVTSVVESGWKERYGRAYLGWLPIKQLAVNASLDYEALNRSPLAANIDGFVDIRLLRAPLELRYFDANGLLGLVRTTIVREQGQFFDVTTNQVNPGKATFATLDLGIGWRYPGRSVIATLEAQNVLDSHFHFQDTDPLAPRIFARRTLLARLTVRL